MTVRIKSGIIKPVKTCTVEEGHMLHLSKKWVEYLITQSKKEEGYQEADVWLEDGREFGEVRIYSYEWADISECHQVHESMIVGIDVYEE